MEALQALAGDPETFLRKIWATRVHVHQGDPDILTGLLRLEDVDALLTGSGIRTPAVRLVRDGQVLPAGTYTRRATLAGEPVTGLVDARRLLAEYDAGATVVLQGLQRYWPPLTRLVRRLEHELGHPCQANAYLTPPGAQGFAVHADTHDVFVVQTHGRKVWQIEDGDGLEDLTLEPGLSVYLPTGVRHAARSQEVASLHVTLGINRLTWRSVLSVLSRRVLADASYDAPLPAGWTTDLAGLVGQLGHALTEYADRLGRADPATEVAELQRRELMRRPPVLDGGLLDRCAPDEVGATTRLRRRETSACVVVPDGDRARVLLGDRELRVPRRLEPALAFIGEAEEFAPADLPELTEADAIVLARRLVREGLLRRVR